MSRTSARTLGVALVLAACGLALQQCAAPPANTEADSDSPPVRTVRVIMDTVVVPSSQRVFDAVVYINGELRVAPKTDADWRALRTHALAVADAGAELALPAHAGNRPDWVQFGLALQSSAARAAQAADRRDIEGVLQAGSDMYDACSACHAVYSPDAEG